MLRLAAASLAGTAVEFYDFFVYGTAAALVLGPLFFPTLSPMTGTLAAFVPSRPDSWRGRSVPSCSVTSVTGRAAAGPRGVTAADRDATVAVGCLPTYGTIGTAAPLLLLVLRFLQGLGLGGEWGGAVLLTVEHAPAGRRVLWSSFPQIGPSLGFVLANGVMLGLSATLSQTRSPPGAGGFRSGGRSARGGGSVAARLAHGEPALPGTRRPGTCAVRRGGARPLAAPPADGRCPRGGVRRLLHRDDLVPGLRDGTARREPYGRAGLCPRHRGGAGCPHSLPGTSGGPLRTAAAVPRGCSGVVV